MNYFLKKKKWLAWVIMLTFLFTSFMPSNIMAGNSVAEAADKGTIELSIYATKTVTVDTWNEIIIPSLIQGMGKIKKCALAV